MNLKRYNPYGTVKLCRNNVCIEAKGENGRLLVLAVCIALILAGIAALANAVK
jgi:hypothetical protein